MITIEQQKKGAELMNSLVEKAWESSEFKNQLVNNPKAAIESLTGQKVSDNLKVVAEDQMDSSKIYLNIPSKPDYSEIELTDEQLEIVSGGEIMCVGAWVAVGVGALVVGAVAGYAIGEAVK